MSAWDALPADVQASSGDPSLVEVLGGEPGLLEHILTFLPKGSFKSDDLVEASRSVGRWLQVSKQANQLDGHALWTTLLNSYFPNAPTPQNGFVHTARGLFLEMWVRHRHFAAARILYDRLRVQFDRAVIEMAAAWATSSFTQKRRAKWELAQSKLAAQSDMEWRASFLFDWDGAAKTPPPVSPPFSEVADGDYALERAREQAAAGWPPAMVGE